MDEQQVREELQAGERILWTGRPDPKLIFSVSDIYMIPFSLLWGGFAFFWEGSVLMQFLKNKSPGLVFFLLFGSFFVVVGLYIIFGRFIFKYYEKKKTLYAITNKRVLILTDLFGRNVRACFIEKIETVNKNNRKDGKGSIVFGNMSFGTSMYSNSGVPSFMRQNMPEIPAFYDIPEVEKVYNVFQKAQKGDGG